MITCWASRLYECTVQLSRNDYKMNNFTSWQQWRFFSIFSCPFYPSLLGCTLRGFFSPSPQAPVIIHTTVKEELWAKVQDQNDTDEHHLASLLESFQVYFSLDCSCPAYVVHSATHISSSMGTIYNHVVGLSELPSFPVSAAPSSKSHSFPTSSILLPLPPSLAENRSWSLSPPGSNA